MRLSLYLDSFSRDFLQYIMVNRIVFYAVLKTIWLLFVEHLLFRVCMKKCIKINNRFYLAYNGLGNYYLKSNQFDKSEIYYSKAIEINPKRSAKIYKNRAYLREKHKKNIEAKNDLKSYLKLFPKAKDRGIIEQAIREL